MRWLLSIVGALLALLGIFWILQGVNIIPVGFMAGHLQYAVLGLVAAIIGVGLVFFANRRRSGTRPSGTGMAR